MTNKSKTTWSVILNPAMAGDGSPTREVTSERMEFDANSNRVVFYNGDDVVAFYQHAVGVEPKG